MEGISLGRDHQVYNEGSWRIPGIYLHDWPDRYIHTNFDTAAMIDPTKLKRAAFIAALQGWYLANFDQGDVMPALELLRANALARFRNHLVQLAGLSPLERSASLGIHTEVERAKIASIGSFATLPEAPVQAANDFINGLAKLVDAPATNAATGLP